MACIIHGITAPKWSERINKSLTFGEPAPRARLKPEHGGEQRRRGGVVHRHQRTLHAAKRRNRHPAPPNLSQGEEQKKCSARESEAQGYLEIARRRREARGRDAAASSGERAAAWRESVAEIVGGEPERSAARARRTPPAAAAIDGFRCPLKPLLGCLQICEDAEGLGGPGL